MKKFVWTVLLAVVVALMFAPLVRGEENDLSAEVAKSFNQLNRKVAAEGKKTRDAVAEEMKKQSEEMSQKTGEAIENAGKETGGAIDRQTKAIDSGALATRQLTDRVVRQGMMTEYFLYFIAALVILTGAFLSWLVFKRTPARKSVKPTSVVFRIGGASYRYVPRIVDGRYQSPYQNQAGIRQLYSDEADLRRSVVGALKSNPALMHEETEAGRLHKLVQPVRIAA